MLDNYEIVNAEDILDGEYEGVLYDKFLEAYSIDDLMIETPNGWIGLEGIGKTIEYCEYIIRVGDNELVCADKHILYKCDNIDFDKLKCNISEVYAKDLKLGDIIMTQSGPDMIIEYIKTDKKSNMYDIQLSEGSNKRYYGNGILSHNSLWMQNFACRSADNGNNVLYITLEMSEKKVMKRLGAMRLKVPINDYDTISKDSELINKKIKAVNKINNSDNLFKGNPGKIFVKFWAAGTATTSDFDNFIQRLQQTKGIKINLIIVDYITLIATPKGIGESLYMKGKYLAESLRALGAKYGCPVISGIQVAKDAWNSSDITLESVPESKAIPETCDTFWVIIRNEEMKRQNKYRLKLLKQRDGDFLKSQIRLMLNTTYLTLENDEFIDS
jgi:hypothetical protein